MRYFVFDTETTALIKNSLLPLSKQPHIVEFYGCVWSDESRKIEDEIDFLCKPSVVIEPDAIATHHITNEMVEGCQPFSFYADQVQKFIEGSNAVVAHNLSYDYNMVENEMRRLKRTIRWPIRRICTVENTEHLKGYRLSLGPKKEAMGLYHLLFGETFTDAHRAKADTQALLRCFVELLDRGIL